MASGGSTREPGHILVGRYRLVKRIGEGGMGEVWQAHDASLDEHVALKLVTTPSQNAAERFRREVKLARRIVHPRCARVFDLGENGAHGEMFLTMELVDGISLARVMHQRALPLGAVWLVLADVCGALAAVHAAGVVHRDLKPGNILVDHKGHGVVIDFGVARDLGDSSPALTHGAIGTFDFMAPEQVEHGHDVTPAADIYALGTIMFACATRRLPFVDGNEATRAFARTLGPAPAFASVAPNASAAFADIIDRCLAREPDRRPGLDEIHAVLEAEERRERARQEVPTQTAHSEVEPRGSEVEHRGLSPGTAASDENDDNRDDHDEDRTTLDAAPLDDDAPSSSHATKRLAILPFTGEADVGPLVAEELADALAALQGLEVIAPHTIGPDASVASVVSAHRATHVVTGRVRAVERALDVEAWLVDARGVSVWHDHFRASAAELFGSDGTLPRRIAESLRIEMEGLPTPDVPHEAAVMYMRARTSLRQVALPGIEETIALLDECLELAPNWAPAIAARAMGCARARFITTERGSAISVEEAYAAVQRALMLAPHLADTHFAAAIFAVEEGRFSEGVDRLRATLAVAPMHALSLAMLGRIEGEIGRVNEGVAHLREAARIDPRTGGTLSNVARIYALRGRWDDAMRILDRARSMADGIDVWGTTTRLRAWRGGPVNDVVDVLARIGEHEDPMRRFVRANALFVVSGGKDGADELRALLQLASMLPIAARAKSFILQLGAEIFASRAPDEAMDYLEKSAAVSLIDIEWMERCPALAKLRAAPFQQRFRDVKDIVRARAHASWPAEQSRLELHADA